ncbi:anti-repressor protein [Gammaproteobacteria bacterium]
MSTQSIAQTEQQLIPVFTGQIGGVPASVCKATDLHQFLQVATKFADWITGRIEKYGFQENQDFGSFSEKTEKPKGGRPSVEYHLSLDMAKELSMVENNDKGREARRYFIACERKALAAVGQVVPASHADTLLPSEQQTLSEIVHSKVANLPDDVKGKALAEIWSRLHNKFRVAKYQQLSRTQLSEAILYVTQMALRTGGATASGPVAPEYLSFQDTHNLANLVHTIAHPLRFAGSAAFAIWKALRTATRVPSPQRFEVRHLPILVDEIRRIYAAVDAFGEVVENAEQVLIKRIVKNSDPAAPWLDEAKKQLQQAVLEDLSNINKKLSTWQEREIDRFRNREAFGLIGFTADEQVTH